MAEVRITGSYDAGDAGHGEILAQGAGRGNEIWGGALVLQKIQRRPIGRLLNQVLCPRWLTLLAI